MPLEELEKELYSSDEERLKKRAKTAPVVEEKKESETVSEEWREGEEPEGLFGRFSDRARSFFEFYRKTLVRVFIAAVLIVAAVFGYLLYQIFTFSGIDIKTVYPEQVLIGVPFEFTVSYSNNSGATLRDAKLLVNLPQEFVFVGERETRRVVSKSVGDIGVMTVGKETFTLMAVKGSKSSQRAEVTLEYNPPTLGSRFQKKFTTNIFIGEPAISLDLYTAKKVLSGELFETRVTFKNVSHSDLRDLELRLEYPLNFSFKTSSLKPDAGNALWRLGDLRSGSSNDIVIQGNVVAAANSFFEIKAFLTLTLNDNVYTINEKAATVSVSPAPLAIGVTVNNRTDYTSKANDELTYRLAFVNNTDVGFRDVIIKAKLVGEMFDFTSIKQAANFNSITNTFIWNASNLAQLRVLEPGQSGVVEFAVKTKENYPIQRISDKNFVLKVETEIESPTVPSFVAADRTISIAKLETKVAGAIKVDSQMFFRDAVSGIVNAGSLPPMVNQPINFTIHWKVENFATDVENVLIRAFLRPGVRATGVIKSTTDTQPVYNERTQEVIWNIPRLRATQGIVGQPVEAIFQVEAVPSINQIGIYMPIIGETTIQATDLFAGVTLTYTDPAIDTLLLDDATVQSDEGRVKL